MKTKFSRQLLLVPLIAAFGYCGGGARKAGVASDAAKRVYVAPGDKDEVYLFASGGYSGQMSVYGIPSGRLFRVIPIFSQDPTTGYGYSEETKAMLKTTRGQIPWDDSHHPFLSKTKGEDDGRWIFINGNNTPRIARVDLKAFDTEEIIEIPNSAGNHGSPYGTENNEYLMAATRFSVPIPQQALPVSDMEKGKFKATISMIKVDPKTGHMSIDLQVLVPGYSYDLASCGKGPSKDWCFFTTYNTEQASKMLEINASKNDKDYMLAFNWAKAKSCIGAAKTVPGAHYNNHREPNMPAVSTLIPTVKMITPKDCPGVMYYLPTPKSPHGSDVDPSGEYIVAGGKLASLIVAHSFKKLVQATTNPAAKSGEVDGIPILKYESTMAGEVKKACLGPLHNEFDNNGYGYTSCFVSSEVVKWKIGTWEVIEHLPAYYSIGHLSVVGGGTAKPYGKYLVALNKITKDRYLPVGLELMQSAQLYDISGSKSEMLLDFPTIGEPHYAQMIPASKIKDKTLKIYRLEDNKHPYGIKNEEQAGVVRDGDIVHVKLSAIRSHFKPDFVEVNRGDTVYFHVTNLEQDYDIPHGFAVSGGSGPNILIMPGQTLSMRYDAKESGVFPFYCTDFCSALHQEMHNFIRVK
ncbi:MAG: Sec-dependent nitrous-oxide reductase [Spirochaetes bacterium]|nr:Sec-dependent nitrous-oxide reductase [Spirochaetota bacterium]